MFSQIDKPLIMGILNITPDSFSDGGKYTSIDDAIQQVERMLAEGVDIIDIGGESTRPGSDSVTAIDQIQRVIPVITAIRQQLKSDILISIDTTSSAVAKAALEAGANIINDVSAGQDDAAILALAAQTGVPIILMHSQGTPKTMQDNPYYEDVVQEVIDALKKRINAALKAGIKKENIALDPGIGFGKRKQDNLDLLAHLDALVALGYPVLLGTSRKRFMGTLCDVTEPSELVTATAVTTALGVMAGVRIFRVHDVKENRQAAIGGESTQTGSDSVTVIDQIQRVIPVITAIRQQLKSDILISIDTTSSEVAKAALAAGANIINDVSAGQDDEAILALAAQTDVPIILMHSQGTPKTMQDNPYYEDVVQEVIDVLKKHINAALKAGIKKENIALDPGIGFGKRRQDNLDLLAHLDELVALGLSGSFRHQPQALYGYTL